MPKFGGALLLTAVLDHCKSLLIISFFPSFFRHPILYTLPNIKGLHLPLKGSSSFTRYPMTLHTLVSTYLSTNLSLACFSHASFVSVKPSGLLVSENIISSSTYTPLLMYIIVVKYLSSPNIFLYRKVNSNALESNVSQCSQREFSIFLFCSLTVLCTLLD